MSSLNSKQQWMVNLSGLLATMNKIGCENLEIGDFADQNFIQDWKRSFRRDWGINSKGDLLESLKSLEEYGHQEQFRGLEYYWLKFSESQFRSEWQYIRDPKEKARTYLYYLHRNELKNVGIKAWDYGRYVFLCRQGYYLNMLSEAEAWQLITPIGKSCAQKFKSWQHYGISYIVGKLFWSGDASSVAAENTFSELRTLLGSKNSPWNKVCWQEGLRI